MKNFDFDKIISRKNTYSEKYEPEFYKTLFPNAPADSLPMWVADMDFATAPCVEESIQKRAAHPIFGYTDVSDDLYEKISWWQTTRHQYSVKKEEVSFYSGVVAAIGVTIRALTNPGEGIVIQEPVYYPFRREIEANNRIVFNNKLIDREGTGYYEIDFDDLEKQLSNPTVTMMVLCSPHNPVGRVWTKAELEKIGTLCVENSVVLVSDEIHSDLILGGTSFVSVATLESSIFNQSIILTSVSKTFNLAGLSMAYSVIPNAEIRKKVDHEISLMHYIPHTFGTTGMLGAYQEEGAAWVDALCQYLTVNMQFIAEYLANYAPNTVFLPSEGTYLGWIDCRKYSTDKEQLACAFIDAGILMDPGYLFGENGIGYTRINAASPRSLLEQGLERTVKALKLL